MRVLMVSLDRGLFGAGHSGDVVERHKRYANLAGHLDVIVFAGHEFERKDLAPNFRIIPTRSSKRLHFKNAFKIASEFAKTHPYDLLVTQDFAAPAGAKIKDDLKIPWIVNIHGMFFSQEWLKHNPLNWYLFFLIKKAIQSADGFRVNNVVIMHELIAWGIKKPIIVQPTPIDLSKFFVGSKLTNKVLKILFVGRLEPEKNVEMLISAVKSMRENFVMEILGDGSERKRLEDLAREDDRIKFLGSKVFDELPPIFQGADIFVLPSNTESFGQVILQAAAARCAIVATKTVGAASILSDQKDGILIGIGDQKGLSTAISKLLRDPGLRLELGARANARARDFDAENGIAKTINFWKQIAAI